MSKKEKAKFIPWKHSTCPKAGASSSSVPAWCMAENDADFAINCQELFLGNCLFKTKDLPCEVTLNYELRFNWFFCRTEGLVKCDDRHVKQCVRAHAHTEECCSPSRDATASILSTHKTKHELRPGHEAIEIWSRNKEQTLSAWLHVPGRPWYWRLQVHSTQTRSLWEGNLTDKVMRLQGPNLDPGKGTQPPLGGNCCFEKKSRDKLWYKVAGGGAIAT